MKATKAYIASLGTTGALLAASVLMLAVVSAVVAFDRWPDGQISAHVPTLVLAEHPAPIRLTDRPGTASATAARTATPAGPAAPRATANGPAAAGKRFPAGVPIATPTPLHVATPATP